MKKLLLLLLFPAYITGQTREFRPDHQTFIEVNAGMGVEPEWQVNKYPFASVTINHTIDMGDYSLIDLQAGLAVPSIFTAKVGAGNYYGEKENISLIIGCRLYPLMLYSQLNIDQDNGCKFTISTELGSGGRISSGYKGILHFGYKWPLIFKKEK